jgi:hypothetical protein
LVDLKKAIDNLPEELAQLAQFAGGFRDFAQGGMNEIK